MINLSIRALSELLQQKQISIQELCGVYHDRCQSFNVNTNALISICAELSAAELLQAQQQLDAGELLAGVPLVHKDLFCTQGIKTTCGSNMLADFKPPYDATAVTQLAAAGMVNLGKANMDEFAMGSSNEHSAFGVVKNPWDSQRVPGGSSGGSAAAVAARMVPVATGTDTGGSIRQPAAFCGITGIKPSYGRVSRHGMVAFASSLDQAGVLAVSADDCGLVLSQMCGHDPLDSTSLKTSTWQWDKPKDSNMQGLRVGVPHAWIDALQDEGIKNKTTEAIEYFKQQGASIIDIELPHADLAVSAYYVLAPAECSSNLSRFDGVRFGHQTNAAENLEALYRKSRSEGFGEEVKKRIMIGAWALSAGYYDAYYLKAQKVRRLISEDFNKAFESVDVIASPVSPELPFKLGEKADGVSMYEADKFTIPASLAGLPCLSMPIGFTAGLPVGLQLIGRYFDEQNILALADKYQLDHDHHMQIPEAFL
ncbi:Asp-tRNA(Asn)/Glu-tRNA(Gln) amidotransferase subunit GatA [Marinicella sp. S1101]|uniref:Asp-tRNA(Asn)/Glu-tRNA(Gln) amidotransferase subunit GatA n=1 Tax=Marinicella marina TaxID=2996016 RepID=UPI0022609C0B|nr:Asp-tRNA(Asn)/Glu-tRNA(Gln) amidotransferase subunit GatA [Marinicella marina]MCX7552529.1 Asp-tRNA(Asn)/Glu-tRNA(Gln) amidotransferase subunit GatA [Marinicella marina]MDJ1139405.1 Asp-tRNA(Asn)/Glu-tRNA(Gln) amidotransferase subunit GatA [Marinicella marina]